MLAGCGDNEEGQDMGLHGDPPGYSLFIWSNESDHRITMTVTDRFEKKEILPGESLLQEEVGFVTPPSLEGYMIDGVSIVFDDGPYGGVFFRTDKVTAFNPCLECNYTVERSNIDGYIGFCRWTYTFTNADYDAAVARGPMKEQSRNPAGEYFPAGFLQETLPKPFAFSKNIPTFVVNRLTGPDYEKIIVSADIAATRYPHDGLQSVPYSDGFETQSRSGGTVRIDCRVQPTVVGERVG